MTDSYAKCISRSQRACWDLDYFRDISLDFTKPFLPEDLARTGGLEHLSPSDRLHLNQIRGHAYAYLFRFVEEYIVGLIQSLPRNDVGEDDRAQALRLFEDEERKHQELFRLFEERFRAGFPVACDVVGGMNEVAKAILSHSQLAVLLLTSMLEWLTQDHYLAYFDKQNRNVEIDNGFKELFRLHWVEEAQHARLDSLEVQRISQSLSEEVRLSALGEFFSLCDALHAILDQQAALDVSSLERVRGESFSDKAREGLEQQQSHAYFHSFIGLGLRNRHFQKVVHSVTPKGMPQITTYLQRNHAS